MQSMKQLLPLLVGLCASVSAEAVGPTASAIFEIKDPVTNRRTPTLEARLDQYVCFSIRAELVPDGEHSIQLTIYDGLGKERHRIVSREGVSSVRHGSLCHGFDEDDDAPGTWWYVVELDGEPLISASIEIRPNP